MEVQIITAIQWTYLHFIRNIYNSGNIKLNSVRIDFPPNIFMREDCEV